MSYRIDIRTLDGSWRPYGVMQRDIEDQGKAFEIFSEATQVHATVRLVEITEKILAQHKAVAARELPG